MILRTILAATILASAGAPAVASQADSTTWAGAPQGSATALYCLRTEPVTGSRIGTITCLTRDEWADGDVDIDQAWAEDGVKVIA